MVRAARPEHYAGALRPLDLGEVPEVPVKDYTPLVAGWQYLAASLAVIAVSGAVLLWRYARADQ